MPEDWIVYRPIQGTIRYTLEPWSKTGSAALAPGDYHAIIEYTVPTGRRLYLTSISVYVLKYAQLRVDIVREPPGGSAETLGHYIGYGSVEKTFTIGTLKPIDEEETLKIYVLNNSPFSPQNFYATANGILEVL